MADFLTTLQSFESGDYRHPDRGGTNIANTRQGTSSGQAQGFNQITTGTWKEFGGLAYAPTPLQATRDQQNAIAAKIPLGRWAPETLAFLRNQGFSVNTKATLADNIAANHGTLGTAPPPHTPTPGTTLNTTVASGAPNLTAGGPSAPAAPGQPAAPQGGLAASLPGFTPNSPGAKMTAQGLQSLAGGQTGQDAPQPMHLPSPPPAMAVGGQMMMGPGGMNMLGRQMAQQAPANQYGFRPAQSGLPSTVGSSIQSAPAGGASGLGLGLPGTTLNSPSQLQMAMMYGSLDPSDPYGRMGGGMYGGMT